MIIRSIVILILAAATAAAQQPQKVTINYPTRSGAAWQLFIAKEGGYYQKYGLDANLVFANHPAGIAMVISGEAFAMLLTEPFFKTFTKRGICDTSTHTEALFTVSCESRAEVDKLVQIAVDNGGQRDPSALYDAGGHLRR